MKPTQFSSKTFFAYLAQVWGVLGMSFVVDIHSFFSCLWAHQLTSLEISLSAISMALAGRRVSCAAPLSLPKLLQRKPRLNYVLTESWDFYPANVTHLGQEDPELTSFQCLPIQAFQEAQGRSRRPLFWFMHLILIGRRAGGTFEYVGHATPSSFSNM